MARPTKPKEIKPKADIKPEGGPAVPSIPSGNGLSGMKLIIVNTVITLIICVLFVASNYFIVQKTMSTAVNKIGSEAAEEGEEGEVIERGHILDLGEFILNLSDPNAKRYLKVNVALEITKKETDPDIKAASGGGHGGHGGEAADPAKVIEKEMNQFKHPIRDAIISTLSSKTAEELSTTAGKELAKEQIKESVDGIFAGEREVLRVSFGNFIIQ